jgi:hypothetical protein
MLLPIMHVLAGVMGLFLISFFIHIALWRVRVPKNQVVAILYIFLGVLILATACLHFSGIGAFSYPDFFHLGLFFVAATMVYVVTYLGTKDVGPSFLMLKGLGKSTSKGLMMEDFYKLVTNEYLIETRLQELLAGQLIEISDRKMQITSKGIFYSSFYTSYRKALGIKELGG